MRTSRKAGCFVMGVGGPLSVFLLGYILDEYGFDPTHSLFGISVLGGWILLGLVAFWLFLLPRSRDR
jgi:hypothetical protein